MFVDNIRKIICLSVPGTDSLFAREFFTTQFDLHSITVNWTKMATGPIALPTANSSFDENGTFRNNTPGLVEQYKRTYKYNYGKNPRKIADLIADNTITSPINEYNIYGICTDPITRVIVESEEMTYISLYKNYINNKKENEEVQDFIASPSIYERMNPDNIKQLAIQGCIKNFSVDDGDGYLIKTPEHMKPQSEWLKYQGQNINHIFKRENYVGFVSVICSLYGIDASLYDDMPRIASRKTNLTAADLSDDLKTTILEFYAEDQALYDSL